MIKYFEARDVEERMKDLIGVLGMDHIPLDRVSCVRSKGSSARRTIARCHGMPKIMQMGMKTQPFYVIEVISEQFDKMREEDQIKTIIHELLHIPKNFGGGFRHHDFVNHRNIEKMYKMYKARNNITINDFPSQQMEENHENTVDKRPRLFRFF